MPRRREVPKRTWAPDPVYHDALVTRLTNKLMLQGKKAVAERIVHEAFATIHERTREDPVKVYRRALENVMPVVEVRSRRVGGSTYQVPIEVRDARRVSVGLRWLVAHARSRSGKSMVDKLSAELMEASHNRGAAVKKKEDVHRMAEANKAFAHYRW